jgi:acetylornithine deacetylase/succinyl-diaminopimelate desuccinylase-like protein
LAGGSLHEGATLVKEHIFGATCTICGIQTGHTEAGAKTVLPSTAMARLDFRLVPDLTLRSLLLSCASIWMFAVLKTLRLLNWEAPPWQSRRQIKGGARRDRVNCRSLWRPGADLSDGSVEWTSGRRVWRLTPPTPVASFGTSYAGSNPHGPDENIRVDDFLQSIKFIGRVITSVGGEKQELSKTRRNRIQRSKPTAPLPLAEAQLEN